MFFLKSWASLALVPLLFAQQDPKFKIRSSTVVVDAIVTDGKGNTVTNLTGADFQLFENGVAQNILSFEPPLPADTNHSTLPASSTSRVTARPPGAPRSLRLITLVIDVADMRVRGLVTAIDSAHRYVDRAIGEQDFVAVYAIGSDLRLVVPYTKDKQKIYAGLDSLKGKNGGVQSAQSRDATVAEMASLGEQSGGGGAPGAAIGAMASLQVRILEVEMAMRTTMQMRVLFRALRAIALSAADLPGRKNVVLFSEGLPETPETRDGVQSVVAAANRGNVAFYVIDPSGLSISTMNNSDVRAAVRRRAVVAGESKFDPLFRMSADGDRDALRVIADQSGGLMVKNQNELTASLDRIDRDLREFYTLTYQSTNSAFDGSFRAIKVAVAAKHLQVRYRKGYYALAPGEEMN